MPILTVPAKFDSAPDPDLGQFTRLKFNQDLGTVKALEAYQGSRQVFSLAADAFSPFTISFYKYDLATLSNNRPWRSDPGFLGVVDYPHPLTKPRVTRSDASVLELSFDEVPPIASPPLSQTDFESIRVKMIFKKATDKAAAGWIDLDMEFDYPDAVKQDGTDDFAWQTRIFYPELRFLNSNIYDSVNQKGFLLLDPLGKVEGFYHAGLRGLDAAAPFKFPMPVPFAAIYELTTEGGVNAAGGVAMAAVDNYGNHKELVCLSTELGNRTSFSFQFIAPMHLKSNRYVRPATYKLSNGIAATATDTDRLFSGAGMHYRIRCFNIEGELGGVPVDWYDVANLYRKWVRRSKVSKNFRKDVLHPPSPVVSNMNPHTVVINYSLDGQIDPDPNQDPPVQNNDRIRTWLEVHPATTQPDISGNDNVTIPALLARLQEKLAGWFAWERLGGVITSAPAAASRPPDLLDVFALGRNKRLVYTGWDGKAWSDLKDLSTTVTYVGQPACASWGAARVDVFARAAGDQVHHYFKTATGWQPVERMNLVALALAAASSAANVLDLFILNSDKEVQHTSFKGRAWSAPKDLGAPPNVTLKALASCFRRPNLLYVFALDDKGALWLRLRTGATWDAGWATLGGSLQDTPTAISWGSNRVDIFARGKDAKLKHKFFDGGAWSDWDTLDAITSAPAAVAPSRNRLELFTRNAANNALLRRIWDTRLEAQIWGFEMGGFYRYVAGLPPASNVITNDFTRFNTAMQALDAQGVVPAATTDPLMPTFNRTRFRGHVLKSGTSWVEAIGNAFPASIEQYLNPPGQPSRGTTILRDAEMNPINDRVLTVNRAHPDYAAFDDSVAARKWYDGNIIRGAGPLADVFYGTDTHAMCPVENLENAYLGLWVQKGLLDEGFRLLEFMKYHYSADFCYDRGHVHLVPQPAEDNPKYTNVVGFGPWHLARLVRMLKSLQRFGTNEDRGRDAAFSLAFEFIPLENLVPYLDEFYERDCSTARMFIYTLPRGAALPARLVADSTSLPLRAAAEWAAERRVPVFHFIYSELITQKMDLADMDNLIHPGYREMTTGTTAANPMLAAARDDDANNDAFTFAQWRGFCDQYGANFAVDTSRDGHGIAPTDYPTAGGGTYTYSRNLAATFNLRSWIFRYGAAAVMGERIILPADWFELPSDYYEEAILMGVRAAAMQMHFKEFFGGGYMLGQTNISKGNKALWAWRVRRRNFSDVGPLVSKLYGSTPAAPVFVYDAISRGTDVELLAPPESAKYPQDALYNAFRITTDKIQHMIWCRDLSETKRELLYVFANVGNRPNNGATGNDPKVTFTYSRGLETGTGWKRVVYTFDAVANGRPDQARAIQHGGREEMVMAPRSLKAVRIFQ